MRVFPCENRVKSSVLHYVSTVPVMAMIIHSKCLSLITVFVTRAIGHLTVVCSLPWPLNRSEARGDLVLSGPPNVNFRKISFRKTI